MFIQTEETPNPETLKFLPGKVLLEQGTYECVNPEEAGDCPLAQRLFKLQGVRSVFISGDFVSVTKAEDTDWVMLKPMVLASVMEHLSVGMPVFNDNAFAGKAAHGFAFHRIEAAAKGNDIGGPGHKDAYVGQEAAENKPAAL